MMKNLLFRLLEDTEQPHRHHVYLDLFITSMIVLNGFAVAMETVDSIWNPYKNIFNVFEYFSIAVFTMEYLTRLWVCTEYDDPKLKHPFFGRLRYMIKPFPLIDLIAILPFYLSSFFALDLRFMRIFRLIRIFRLGRRSESLQALGLVVAKESRTLLAALVVMIVLLFTSSSFMYYLERGIQPEKFGSIPKAMWWGIAALTTVGFGDSVPHSDGGKLLAGIVMLFGIMVFALPAGIIASGLVREIRSRNFINTWKLVARVPILKNLDALQIAGLVEMLQPRFAQAGQVLWAEQEKADRMYFIVSGVVQVQRGGETIEISSGEFCGEMALLFGRRRKARVRAKTYCELLALDAKDFQIFLENHPDVKKVIEEKAQERLG